MVKLKEIPRTATFAWSPVSQDPFLVTGTVAGAVDADFSSTTKLELWDLNLIDRSPDSFYLEPKVSIDTDARFYDIAWGCTSYKPQGVIAGALENGLLELWDAEALLDGSSSFAKESKHSGYIKAVEFNPIQKHLIATGGASGEIFIWDINSLSSAFAPGRTPTRNNDVDAIAWNNNVAHILASGSSEGTSIWDLKNRKEVLHLNFQAPGTSSRNLVSSIAWHPDNSTTLVTSSSDEASPVILTWDLRNSNAPQQIIQGHDKGVLSIDWCKKDSTFLLSSGKDNRTLLWDPLTGEKIGDYPVTSNWNFQTSFNPNYPDIFASASFDGKICVQTLQDTNSSTQSEKKGDSEDFWNSNNYIDSQHPTVSLKKAPKWLGRPASVSFGFGGKIVSVEKTGDKQSVVKISKFSGDESLISETSKLATALESGSVSDIISEQVAETKGTENYDWSIIELISKDGDKKEILKKYISGKDSDKEDKATEKPSDKKDAKDDGMFGDDTVADDDFLSTLSLDSYTPSGSFGIYKADYSSADKSITKAILSGDLEKAVNIAIKEDRLSDAFAIASRGSEATRIKVQNAYLAKNAEEKPYLRLLYSVGSKDLTDIVQNSDVSEWKEVLEAVISLVPDAATYQKLVTSLGDRLLEARGKISDKKSKKATDLRNHAVLCFSAAESLPNISKLWLSEVSEKETTLLKDEDNQLTPYSAHVKALHSFIEKITVFRKAAPGISATGAEKNEDLASLYDAYRDYANIVATQGQLSLAETYLNLVPSQHDGASLERDRVMKASNKTSAPATTANKSYTKTTGVSNSASPAKQFPTMPFGAPSTADPFAASSPFGVQAQAPAARTASPYAPPGAVNPYAPAAPTVAQPSAPSLYPPTTPGPSSSTLAAGASKPFQPGHARGSSGIFTPSNPIIAPYQPNQNALGKGDASSQAPPPPPPPTSTQVKNKNMSGWNDLPSSAIPQSRKMTPAAPTATSTPFGNPSSSTSSFSGPSGPQYGRQTPAQALGPPPSGSVIKPPPSQQISPAPTSASATPAPVNNKYAPAKPASPQAFKNNLYGPAGGFGADQFGGPLSGQPAPNAFSPPPPNPYANLTSASSAQPPANPYGPPPSGSFGNMGPSLSAPPAANPYGPPPTNQQFQAPNASQGPPPTASAVPPNGYAPPPTNSQYAPIPQPQQQQQQPPQQQQQMGGYPSNSYAPQQIGAGPGQFGQQGPPLPQQQAAAPPAPEPEPVPVVQKHPPGDRSHIPPSSIAIYEIFSQEVEKVAPHVPQSYVRQLSDCKKRLDILFDHLNNEELLSDETITDLIALAQALQAGNYDTASELQLSIFTTRSDECGQWMVGVKRLIDMCRVLSGHMNN